MKKRLKLLSMLLISAIMINVLLPVTKANAAIPEVLDVPTLKKEDSVPWSYESITKEDSGKMQKIVIDNYSYLSFIAQGKGFYELYSDVNKTNKILEGKGGDGYSSIFIPKGEYYFYVYYTGDGGKYGNDSLCIMYGKASVTDLMKGIVTKYKNDYSYIYPYYFDGGGKADFIGLVGNGYCYDLDYNWTLYIDENKISNSNYYNNISFKMYLKDKNSSFKITPTGKTKEILDLEAKGGTYDTSNYEEEMKNDTSNKKKKDTKKPTVKGVKNNKTYKKSVKFKVSDKSGIKKVTLNKKKIKVSKAKKGYTVKKNGKYTLKVWDKAGNVRTVKFKIKK